MSNLTESGDGQGAAVLTQDVVKSSTATSLGGRSSTNSSCGSSTRGKRRRSKQNNLLTVADVYDIAADIGMETKMSLSFYFFMRILLNII